MIRVSLLQNGKTKMRFFELILITNGQTELFSFRKRGTDHVLHEKVDENAAHIAATFNE